MKDATRLIRAVFPDVAQSKPFLPGPTFAATYHLTGDPGSAPYTYGRFHNPTWTAYENAISDLERASSTIVFASGMAAVAALLGVTLKSGDVLVMPSEGYYSARTLAGGFFANLGVKVRTAPTAGNAQRAHLHGARLLWLETPTNPGLDVCDIALLAEAAHAEGALVVVDNTTPSCLGQQPLSLGADFSLSSDTKITTGHSDITLGHVSVRDTSWGDQLRTWRTQMGSTPGPMEVWLAHRSLATLEVRLERQSRNAGVIAEFLAARPEVRDVRYPGLSSHPGHAIASRQMKFYGPVVSFELAGRDEAQQFLSRGELVFEATSFGGVHTTAERRARWGGDAVPEGFIRMSVGCEDADDLVADLRQSLDKLPPHLGPGKE
ncbi:MAG: cystathionine gamma-lyase [Acidobacteria bacterium]|nr:cystathionine gamma-lyase [Acidobacteriota bacterium]